MVFKRAQPTLKLSLSKVSLWCNQRLTRKNEFWKVSNPESAIKPVNMRKISLVLRYILEMFDTISSGIDALFERMGCDRQSVTKRLGNSSTVDTENILDFLLKIENQSNVLIRIFLTSQQDTIEVGYELILC